MKNTISTSLLLFIALISSINIVSSQSNAEPFEFIFENKKLKGLIEAPNGKESEAIVIIVPGYGKTDFVNGNWFSELRNKFTSLGLTVVFWDKMGCGNSEGEFDALQPVENSADEAIAAIQEIKRLEIPGHEKIGLWGLSRAGWICPLINKQHPIDFWISVSGTDDKENFGYLLKSNLIIAGKGEDEAEALFQSWMLGHRLSIHVVKYEQYLDAIKPLALDSTSTELFGFSIVTEITEKSRDSYRKRMKTYTSNGHFDEESGLWVYIEEFDKLLGEINCPVLALFGENDSQVDWRKTKKLYKETIGKNPNARLKIKTFEHCNHSMQRCITCAYQEDLSALKWQACDGYYDAIESWLKQQNIID